VVTDDGGRTVAVHPATQMVLPMVAWVTEGLIAPGVRAEFGKTAPAALTTSPTAAGMTRAAVGVDVWVGCGVLVAEGPGTGSAVVDDADGWLLSGVRADADGLAMAAGTAG
jgi:hypothetical protein